MSPGALRLPYRSVLEKGRIGQAAVDDTLGSDILLGSVSNWFAPPDNSPWFPWVAELPKGGPPSDTPFKPPRA